MTSIKSLKRLLPIAFSALLIFFFNAFPALAQEGAKSDPVESPAGVIFKWLNFIIVFGGFAYLIAKHGGAFFSGNAKAIAASILEATAAKDAADSELREVTAKVEHLDKDLSAMRDEAQKNWAAEVERLRTSSLIEIDKINQAARGELAASERAAQQQLRQIAASFSVERAAVLVSSRMNPQIRSKMFQSFLDKLGKGAN
jgi:F0F1-type ATP synthase membrane subunit b/b'